MRRFGLGEKISKEHQIRSPDTECSTHGKVKQNGCLCGKGNEDCYKHHLENHHVS